MSEIVANDLRAQYNRAFDTIREIVEVFPGDRWLKPHGDIYYIPCRIAYHLAVVIDGILAGGFNDKDFAAKLPYGKWSEAKAEDLPNQAEFISYLNGALDRAGKVLTAIDDEGLMSPEEPEKARFSDSKMGLHLILLRELSAHTGELNKMLIEDGLEDVWK